MAYLTKHNLGQLSQKLNINVDVSLKMFLEHIYNDPEIFSILNNREIEYLFKYKMLLDDEKQFAIQYYNEVPEKADSKKFVFNKGGKIKYHLSPSCKLITKDYLDFNIPDKIKSRGDEAIQEYRTWFNTNDFGDKYRNKLIDRNTIIAAFNLKYPKKYDIEPIKNDSNLLVIERPNSTFDKIESSYDQEKTKRELRVLKHEWYQNFPCGVTKTIAKYKGLLDKTDDEINSKISEILSPVFIINYGMIELKRKFEISKNITYKIISLILEHIKWTYNLNDKVFDNNTLEKFGLECCLNCLKESKNNYPTHDV